MTAETIYLLGEEDEELLRLQRQHEIWTSDTTQLLNRAGFSRGQTLLDLGCGPGFTTFDLGAIVDDGRVIGVDSSAKMIRTVRQEISRRSAHNVTALQRSIEDLDASIGPVDGVFARWVFCYLSNPQSVVRKAGGLLRPGGSLAVMDYFNYLSITVQPASSHFDKVYRAVFDSFENSAGGLEVGRRLPAFMEASGFRVDSIEPVCAMGRPGSPIWDWLSQFQKSYLPKLVNGGFLTESELGEFDQVWTDLSTRSDAFLFAPPMIAIVGVKL